MTTWSRNASMKEDLPNDAFPATRTFKLTCKEKVTRFYIKNIF